MSYLFGKKAEEQQQKGKGKKKVPPPHQPTYIELKMMMDNAVLDAGGSSVAHSSNQLVPDPTNVSVDNSAAVPQAPSRSPSPPPPTANPALPTQRNQPDTETNSESTSEPNSCDHFFAAERSYLPIEGPRRPQRRGMTPQLVGDQQQKEVRKWLCCITMDHLIGAFCVCCVLIVVGAVYGGIYLYKH